MAKHKATEPQPKEKVFTSAEEMSESIVKLRARIHQVEELKKDGLPYRDALRVTAEYQLRDTIRDIFGERSPEYLQNQNLRIKVNSKHSINETISLLQHLVVTLEERRLELLGLRSVPANRAGEKPRERSIPTNGKSGSASSGKTPQSLEPTAAPQPVAIPSATIPTVQPVQPTQTSGPARATLTVEVKQPVVEPPLPPAAPPPPSAPILLVSQTKLKLSAEAVAHVPNEPIVSVSEPLRFQAAVEPADVPETQPSLESSMAPKLSFPSPETPMQLTQPQRTMAAPEPVGNGHDVTARYQVTADTSTDEEGDMETISHLREICSAFHRVARQLRQRRDERPTLEVEDERDVLDLLHALLSIQYDSIEPEEWTPSYANGSTRTDLWLKEEGVVIIAKKTKQGLGAKALTHQVSVDFERYGSHPGCKLMFCFIYDPEGRIGHPKGLEGDLTLNYNGRRVEALISPK